VATGLLEDLTHRGLRGRLLGVIGLAFGEGPVVVLGAMDDQDTEFSLACLAKDETPGGSYDPCHGGHSRCECPYLLK
jgi:hypothetical protein